ncbi:hypothetical protein G4228_003023 [Cervus hanglu yarkandensis]|nr:hypothetical protein G4228_003023 [Cervus hanglu yarkandensis]
MPPQNLGRVDKYNRSFMDVVYTPVSNLTQQIMNKTACAPVMKAYCRGTNINDSSCALEKYWKGGFVPLQAAINAAIIQTTTNHSVMEELMSVTAINMKTLPFIFKENLQNEMFIFYCLLYFSPFIYFLSLNVTRERKKYKDLMNLMGLQDSAFWLSWGLIYAAFIFVTSIIITVIITSTEIIILTGFTVIFTLFFLYGLSLIALAFLMTVLLKKTILTSLVVFLLTLFWGGVGFTAFYQQLPSPLKWIFSICSPFAFSAGINQIIHLDYTMNGVIFPDTSGDSYIMIATFSILTFDALLYLVLALYFDKILPYGNESHYSPLFFLNSSSCFQHRRTGSHVAEIDVDPEPLSDDYCEPMAPEFHGREAIRIRNVKKVYKEKTGKGEVLKGLFLDIYEGQITAILGHSGAGKSALLSTLSGLSVPTEGSVTIYNKNPSEMQDLEEIRKITGVCPQFNVQFDTLTVKENLRLFAKIKGIRPKDVEQEVQRVLLELDIQNIQDNLATLLSEGQKRKLTIGIALLGEPQVLLLDEPTAGLDPFSRQRIWNFLRERKADRVILLSTNLTDEVDILADRKVILSNGKLKCVGSSVFLKRRWGLGYHLSLCRSEMCDPEKITSLINHHIPDAKLKTESKEKLVYTLPAERTNKFPDLFSDLDEGCGPGVMSYEVSTSTLNEVFVKLEGNSTSEQESDIEDFIQSLKHQNILLEVDDFENRNGTEDPSYNGAIIVSGKRKDYQFSVVCNTKRLHCFPVLVSVVSSGLLRMFGQTQCIRTERSAYPLGYTLLWTGLPEGSFFLFIVMCSLSPYIAMNSVSDYKKRTKAQLWISGLFPSAYWCGQALVDVSLYSLILLSMYLIFYLADMVYIYLTSRVIFALVVMTLGYAASLVFLTYVIAFIFRKRRKNSGLWSFCFYVVTVVTFGITMILGPDAPVLIACMALAPSATLSGFITFLQLPYFQALLFMFVLRCLEAKCGKKIMQKDPVFRISPKSRDARSNAEEHAGEDEDVQAERRRTATALNTSIEEVELTGYGSDLDQQGDASIRFLGYCPQENVLWPSLTTREHLEVFAAVKGLRRADARVAISRLVDAFKLQEQLNVPVQKLPGGTARKLCSVLSLLGDPPVLLLDEPSTGLDPAEQKQLWQTIQTAVRNTTRGALLTTHSMAEAEAVCDRVAIMVSGRLRCIGSIQHLKNSLGKDYILELKLKEASQGTSVHTEVLRLFPRAAQQERYSSFLAYRLPVQDVQPLSQAFHKLETVKHDFNLEEYSLSQCTLEKVRMSKRHFSVGQQTRALLGKNFLRKWRMKRETLSEWLFSGLLVLFAHLLSSNLHQVNDFPQLPAVDLGRVDNFNDSDYVIAFAPESKTTQEIMNKLASAPFIKAHCQVVDETVICEASLFWEKGFVAFQAAINAAIIEITTNHSVMEKLMSVTGINMKILPFVAQAGVMTDFFIFFCIISFSAFIYYVSVSVTQERQFLKPVMTVMGLRESAFWLSWGLMYTGFISITATLMALIVTYAPVVVLTGFMVVFTLFLLYGLSLLIHLDYDVNSNIHSDSPNDQYLIIATIFMLLFDALLYLVLTLYLDKILPTEYGQQRPPWFFLKSSSWFQRRRADRAALENDIDPDFPSNDSFEPVSPEFHGKEAIRIRNLKKAYGKGKHEKVEALKGLVFDVYEGQITGILGHSGAGKTTLLNILSGLSAPTSGSITIYNHSLSETADLEHISKLTGVCPQSNVQFGFLTVRENLRLFAKIKGIQPHEVEQQVLLLDEPTAGSDPLWRHRVWNLLRERKSDHVVLFSTPFMDEADVLADRKVFMSNGRLKCSGSSLFLKRKWGIGYHLSLHLNETCDPDSVTSIVKHHIPDAKLTAQSEEKLTYILPLERTSKFPDLYRDLESCSNQGIENYGISMTTLNEVFLKLEGKSAIDESGTGVWEQSDRTDDPGSLAEPEQVAPSFSEANSTVGGLALWRQQVCAVAKVRLLKLKSEKRALLAILLLFGITFGPQLLEHLFYRLHQKSYSWGLSPNMYFLSPGQPPRAPLTRLLVINRTGSSIDDFIYSLRHQNIALEVDAFGTRNGPNESSYNGAITVTGDDKEHTSDEHGHLNMASFWIPGMACFTPYISMGSIGDYKKKVYFQLRISGLYPSAYWFGQALVDVPLYLLILLLMQIMDYVFSPEESEFIIQNLAVEISPDSVDYLGPSEQQVAFLTLLIPYLHFFIFLFILRCLEMKFRKKSMRKDPVFRISPRSSAVFPNPEKPEGEDEDVQMERRRTADAVAAPDSEEKPAIVASCLRKEYAGRKKNCFAKGKKKVATRNVSFCVKKGEVLGLLGHNGAGKSTTIKMITGETRPTSGQVLLAGGSGGAPLGFLGYCPQESALWPSLTVREHLEVSAAVKGLRRADAAAAIARLADALKLQDQMALPAKALPEGAKRKLSFALSILGSPAVLLLDEPTTGLDPEGQLQMWQLIRASVRNAARGALLTTHSMAEAEAVCDRVAVMVSGSLRCVGSIQHLKSKFGRDYLLEMKLKSLAQLEALHCEVLRLFPQAARQERFASLVVYKLPVEDVHPLSHAFFSLETVKQNFDLEEYSLSQSSLEQVFLELCKEQERDDSDEEVDLSVRWKLLQEEP